MGGNSQERAMSYSELLQAATRYPALLGWAGRFVAELARMGKLTPQGVEDLLGGVHALVKIAREPSMTPARLAAVARMLANTLDQQHGQAAVDGLFRAAEQCGGKPGNERLPRALNNSELVEILCWMQAHPSMRNTAFWGMIAAHIRAENDLPAVDTHHIG